jgi:hypothetical protein
MQGRNEFKGKAAPIAADRIVFSFMIYSFQICIEREHPSLMPRQTVSRNGDIGIWAINLKPCLHASRH